MIKRYEVFVAQLERQLDAVGPIWSQLQEQKKNSSVIRGKLPIRDLGMMESLLFSNSKPKWLKTSSSSQRSYYRANVSEVTLRTAFKG